MFASSRSYLIKAIYTWLSDNELTPQLLVQPNYEGIVLPQGFVDQEQLVLNISALACRNLHFSYEGVAFNARFSGVKEDVFIPTEAIMAIFARENSAGMAFGQEPVLEVTEAIKEVTKEAEKAEETKPKNKPANHLKLIK